MSIAILPRKRVGVFFGGRSSEREVSLSGGRNIVQHIDIKKFDVLPIFWDASGKFWLIPETLIVRNTCKEIEDRLESHGRRLRSHDLSKELDCAFLVTHGKFGDDGCLQGFLEFLHIPYTGSGVLGAALGMDKNLQRRILSDAKISQPTSIVVRDWEWENKRNAVNTKIEQQIGFPCVTKPTREGSTMGVCVNADVLALEQGMTVAFQYDREVLLEPLIRGREFSCVVVGNESARALIPTETIHDEEIFTYDAKYMPGASKKITPMDVDSSILKTIQTLAEKTYEALEFCGYARIDGFLTTEGRILITDPNGGASTGMGPSSWTWHQAAETGWSPMDFLSHVLELALVAHQSKKGPL
ncbi:MAG: ATP-grasp domain-containing protein [Patescibacteria group bacterium]